MKALALSFAWVLALALSSQALIAQVDVYLVDVSGSAVTQVPFQNPVTVSLTNSRYLATLVSPASQHVVGVFYLDPNLYVVAVNRKTKSVTNVLAQIKVETVFVLPNGRPLVHGEASGKILSGNQTVIPKGSGWFTKNKDGDPTKFKGALQISTDFQVPTLGNKAFVNVRFKTNGAKLRSVTLP